MQQPSRNSSDDEVQLLFKISDNCDAITEHNADYLRGDYGVEKLVKISLLGSLKMSKIRLQLIHLAVLSPATV